MELLVLSYVGKMDLFLPYIFNVFLWSMKISARKWCRFLQWDSFMHLDSWIWKVFNWKIVLAFADRSKSIRYSISNHIHMTERNDTKIAMACTLDLCLNCQKLFTDIDMCVYHLLIWMSFASNSFSWPFSLATESPARIGWLKYA